VEIMGSEGYLINQFIARRTNKRTDEWGGSFDNRCRLAVETVRAVREAVGPEFIIIFRLSMIDLVEDGSTWEEVVRLGQRIEEAGASILNTGIGWHEARVPTIATMVPRAAFTWVTGRLKGNVSIPLVTSNRINMPDTAEAVLAQGDADMISMARPFLADPDWVLKAETGRTDEINTCIACNQACLDHVFERKRASCLVNPFACYETELVPTPVAARRRVAVVGAGPAGVSAACTAAERGHDVTLFDAADKVGGQFNLAAQIPGKEEFREALRYFEVRLERAGVNVRLGKRVTADDLIGESFDHVVIATGVKPREIALPGIEHPMVLSYLDVLRDHVHVGDRVALIGAGGIGFDVAEYLVHGDAEASLDAYYRTWGIDRAYDGPGALVAPAPPPPARKVYLCQRSATKVGAGLGKTTGWIHRASLKHSDVEMLPACVYERIDDAGLTLTVDGVRRTLEVDNVIVCAGQVSLRELEAPLRAAGVEVHVIGGADVAAELDAKRAIDQGTRLGVAL
jgi:2,4-dienoyl-CoA reductase (NADPH2)